MAGRERLTLSGDELVAHDFDVFPLEASFHAVPCVYVVTRRTNGNAGRHRVVFVGETASLIENFRDHPRAECFIQHGANRVGVHREEDAAMRRETANELIAQLAPVCNG